MAIHIDQARKLVARSCQILGRQGLTRETAGHVSARIAGDHVVIKGRGAGETALSYTTPNDLIIVDMDGKMVDGREDLTSPNEVFIHTWMLRTRPAIESVIHIHPPTVVAFTIADRPILPVIGAFNPSALRFALEGIPLYPRSILINSDARGEDLAKAMGTARACLMRGHGITTVGRTVEEATIAAINLNDLAEMNYKAALLGTPQPIPDEDLEEFRAQASRGSDRAATTYMNSTWRYYDRLVGEG